MKYKKTQSTGRLKFPLYLEHVRPMDIAVSHLSKGFFYSFPQNQVTMETLCSIPVNNVELHNDVTLRKRGRCELLRTFNSSREETSSFYNL